MPSELFVSRLACRTIAAIREDGVTVELHVEAGEVGSLGDVFVGRVDRVLHGIRSVFVDVGLERNAFLHADELLLAGETHPSDRPALERVREGRTILVQVVREPVGNKGARVTCHVSLPGRRLVFLPLTAAQGISRRIDGVEERERLRRIVEPLGVPTGGFVVRTAGRGAEEPNLRAEARMLVLRWEGIARAASAARPPARVHRGSDLLFRLLLDAPEEGFDRIVLDDPEDRDRIVPLLAALDPTLPARVELHAGPVPLIQAHGLERDFERALRPKVWLPSGAFLVIEETEALVAVDVNTGRFLGKGTPEETALATNLEAADEIARQIRLRDLGGIVVVDFIDMTDAGSRALVVERLEASLVRHRVATRVAGFAGAGLLTLTRKRGRRALAERLLRPCPACRGAGRVAGPDLVATAALEEARRIASAPDRPAVVVRAHPDVAREVARALGGRLPGVGSGATISVEEDPLLQPDRFEVAVR